MPTVERRLDRLCRSLSRDPRVSDVQLRVTNRSNTLDYHWDAPDACPMHLIASSTKMFAAVLVLQRVAVGDLTLDQPLVSILPRADLVGLNRFGGIDRVDEFTVRDVLANTSGIPNYYEQKKLDPRGDLAALTAADPGWSYRDALDIARSMPARFAPHSGRAAYSFTNYQLAGRLIETIYGCSLAIAFDRGLFAPLGLTDTALLTPGTLELFDTASPLLHGTQSYRGARRLASLGAEGGLVSTTADTMRFMRAVTEGEVLDAATLERSRTDRLPLFPRVGYGVGVMALALPRMLTRLPRPGVLFGHAGMTGHMMFADPVSGIRVVGTINQLAAPRLAFRLLIGALRIARSAGC
jgi:D-alanyl-D-alanine carboxypeptidase